MSPHDAAPEPRVADPGAPDSHAPAPRIGRRAVVVGAAALGSGLAVAGCTGAATPPAPVTGPLAPTSDVPVGGATIFAEQGVVVTQATAGDFAAFSAECPHQSCNVASVEDAEIVCPCHGSRFGLDGAVLNGPAEQGLASVPVTVEGDQLTLG
ncbi:Rieske (2Fe-2S) protein [Pseudonocardia sp.]|uniref:Rieske (2Fe-2S) protein n=1 Tax=Pseudonocardia sp. TaxID=60912 RepID=UPI002601B7F5|nr:Rieske (2Fe-2S) protein [Pseudonocardia sp.]